MKMDAERRRDVGYRWVNGTGGRVVQVKDWVTRKE